jgi:hypothetical protein
VVVTADAIVIHVLQRVSGNCRLAASGLVLDYPGIAVRAL